MINPRYAAPVAALLAIALIPTVIHSYRGARLDDGWRAAEIPEMLEGMASKPTARRAEWVDTNFDTADWIERTYTVGGVETTLFVARSYDPKRLYHHPELALLRGTQTTPEGVVRSSSREDVPLHVVRTERGGVPGVAVYALHYGDGYIDNPVLFQLRTSVELLVSRRRPMTLFMTHALSGRTSSVDGTPAARLLLSALREFER